MKQIHLSTKASLLTILLLLLFLSKLSFAQLTGTKNIPGDYATLADAIAALNTQGVGTGGVTLNLLADNPQTAPAGSGTTGGGYIIGGSGTAILTTTSATNQVIIQGNGNTITAASSLVAGQLNDAIFKIIGADWITITGFTMLENPANTTTAASTNNMTEWGVALIYVSTTDNCQNITITGNTIDLNRTYQNTFGIYANATHTNTAPTTSATATGANGGNHNLVITANNITDVNQGIVVVGPTAAADMNNGVTIGGSVANANNITNFGTTGTFSSYANVSGTVNGILVRNSRDINISYNTVESSAGGTTTGTLNGIHLPAFSNTPTGTFTQNINYNQISLRSGVAAGAINGINSPSGSATTTSTININNNNFYTFGHTVSGTAAITFILNASTHQTQSISNNTFSYITVNTTGSVTFISNSNTLPANGTKTVNNNSIVTGFSKTGAGGTVTLHTDAGSSTTGTTVQNNNNNFSNITLTGATTMSGWQNTDGTGATPSKTFTGNTFTNWTCGTSAVTVFNTSFGNTINVSNNTINNISGQGAITGLSVGSSGTFSTALSLNNNTITNLSSTGTGGAVTALSFAAPAPASGTNLVYDNTINNLSSTSTTATVAGISSSGSGVSIYNHTIYALSNVASTSGATNGIMITGGALVNVFKNKIYDLTTSGGFTTTPGVNGILVSAGGATGVNVYNNLIGDLKAPAANSTDAIRGISITSTTTLTTYNIYYNTIWLNASSSGTNFGTTGIFHAANATPTTATLNLRNNIIVNNSTATGTGLTVAYRRSGTALGNYASTSNNNDFYAPSIIMHDGTNSYTSMSAYKTAVAPRDANSFYENPTFQSTTGSSADFLKIDLSTPTQIESGAQPISGITDDYFGTTRNATTPDVGAFEGDMTGLDLSPPNITYTTLGNGIVAGSRAFNNVTITDPSGVNTDAGTKPRVYYKKTTDPNDASGWTYVEADNSSSPFNFTIDYSLLNAGSVSVGDTIQYFVVAQDLSEAVNVGINSGTFANPQTSVNLAGDAFPIGGTINQYTIAASISGTVTVGTGGTYTTLTGAGGLFADINSKVVSGNITALILGDLSEPGTNALNQWTEEPSNSNFTLTIAPNDASVKTISGSFAGGLIRLNGADRVTIDGRYSGSGNYLTFSNTSTSGTIATIQIISSGTGAGANNVTIRNCNISTGSTTNTTGYAIAVGGSTIGTAGDDNDNLTITENNIFKVYTAIFARATATGQNNNLVISKNTIGSNTVSDYVGKTGIDVTQATGAEISGNTIFNFISTITNPTGILIGTGFVNSSINNNLIHSLDYTGTSGYGGKGIDVNTGSASANLNIFNNVIYNIRGDGYITGHADAIYGIRIQSSQGGINIYYNSVNLYGNISRSSATADQNYALYIGSSVTNLNIRNNILRNSIDNTTGVSTSYAIYSASAASAFTAINYNDYFVSGAEGMLGYLTSNRADLAAWQSATGQDGNSLAVNPQFNSNTNLQPLLGSPVLAAGTPITGITTDFLGVTRSATNPSIGAYEEGLDGSAPTITYTALGNTSSTSNRTITATIADVSGVPTSGALQPRIWYRRNHPTPATGWVSTHGTLQSGTGFNGVWEFTIDYSVLGISPAVGDSIQYYIVAQDLASTPNIGTQPAGGVHTDVNTQTSAPANPSRYKIVGPPLSGTYTISGAMFRNITGLDIQFEKKVIQVEKEAIVEIQGNSDAKDLSTDRNNSEILESSTLPYAPGVKQMVKVEEEIYIPMLNGMPYEGKLVANKGNYNLPDGTESVYMTITAALTDLNERGVDGPVTFLLADADYSTGETFPLSINIQIENLPTATNTVTFKPADGVSSSISGSLASNALIRISNSYIIINGTYDSDPSGRNLSITNNSTSTPQVIRIGSIGTTPVVGVQVRNCNITNGTQTSSAIVVTNTDTEGSETTEGYFNNIVIDNNSVKKAYIGIYALAIVQAGNGGITISNNSINSTGSDAIRLVGIYAQGCDGVTVSNNNVGNFEAALAENDRGIWFATGTTNSSINNNLVSNLTHTATGSNAPVGILITSAVASANVTVTQNTVSGVITAGTGTASGISVSGATGGINITRNLVNNVKNTNTGGWGSNGIWLASSLTAANVNVVNNVIYDVASYGWDAGGVAVNGYGIIISSGAGYNVYFNSVNLNTNQTVAGRPAAFNITSGVSGANAVNVLNNIFANNQTQTGEKYSVYYGGTDPAIFNNLNYNNYFTADGTNLGYFNNANQSNLAALKTAIGKDVNSIQGNPGFTTMTNLMPDNSNVNSWNVANKGVHISSVNVDFTGATRPTTPATGVPDIGAYEFANPTIAPPAATQTGTLANGGTTNYSQGGMPLGQIDWGNSGTVPSDVTFNYYSGTPAPFSGSQPRINAYWNITVPDGSGYTYDVTLNYDEATLGSINENNLIVAKSDDNGTTWTPYTTVGTGAGQITRNTTANTIKLHGLTSFSLFTLGDSDNPLPIELTSFVANANGRDVTLNWQTATEVQSSKFVVERKSDKNDNWLSLAEIQAAGNSNSPRDYSYQDKKLNSGSYSYRLKMIDIDGIYRYSDIVETTVELPKEYAISQNYPNPFNPTTRIDYQLPFDSKVMVELYSITGERVAMLSDKFEEAGYYTIEVDGNKLGLSSGVYIYRIVAQNKSNGQQFMNVKKMVMVK